MSEIEIPDQEPAPTAVTPDTSSTKEKSRRRATSTLRRELSEKELTSSATQKFLLDEVDRLEYENTNLANYRSMYHEADKKVAVLEQKSKIILSQEIVSTAALTVGAAAIGYAPSIWQSQPTGIIALTFGAVLVVLGIIAKAVRS